MGFASSLKKLDFSNINIRVSKNLKAFHTKSFPVFGMGISSSK